MDGKKLLPLLAAPAFLAFALALAIVFLLGSVMNINADAAACTLSPANSADTASFAWPTDKHEISQDWQDPDADGYSHSGMDFKVDEGSKVYAVADGTVVSTADNEVVIKHEQEVQTHYKYLKSVLVHDGQAVKKGDQIATSGSGDESPPGLSGAHLHLEIWIDKESNGHLENVHMDTNPFVAEDTSGDDSGNTCGCPGGDLSGTNNQQKAFNYLVQNGYSKEQAAGIVGNMISESGVEPLLLNDGTATGTKTQPADAVNTGRAWGVVQWYPASKMITASRNAGVDDATIGTLAYQLDFLRKQLIGQGPVPLKAVGDAVRATTSYNDAAFVFAEKFEVFTTDPNNPEYARRQANAKHVYDLFAGGAPSADPKNASAPVDPCGAGSGNIAQVAKNLAWPQGPKAHWDTHPSAAKDEYVAAIEKYDGVTKDNWQSLDDPYTDCGRFVATVLRMSGADPNFPQVYTPTQRSYMVDHPEKYDHWESTPPGGMKPGDILNGPGHTYLYVGPWGDGGGWNSAAGSLGQHVPTADNLYDVGPSGFWVFRVKGSTTPTTTPTK